MRIISLVAAAASAALSLAPAAAQDGERYTLEKRGDGYVRMDRRSGEMSLCEERSGQLVCRLAADERDALESEVDRLQAEIEALEERVAALEDAEPAASELSDEQTFDQALGLMERFFRRFIGIVKELEQEFDQPAPEPDAPQRT